MQILDGVAVSAHIKEQLKQEVAALVAGTGKAPHLAAILVGNDPASEALLMAMVYLQLVSERLVFDLKHTIALM